MATMSKAQFELLAQTIKETREIAALMADEGALDPETTSFVMDMITTNFAGTLSKTNSAFDRDKFKRAAGMK